MPSSHDDTASNDAASDVTAIVVAYNSAAVLEGCIAALRAEGARVIVVDNASQDDSAARAAAAGAEVLLSPRNEGYGRGNGLGVAAARSRYVLICNPDITVGQGSLGALIAAAGRFPQAGLVAPLIVEPDGRRFVQPRSLLSPAHLNAARSVLVPEGPASIPFVSGACFLIDRSLFNAIGGFDPEIFLYYEDDDLCRRLMDQRRAPVLVPEAVVTHRRGSSSAPAPGSRFRARWHLAWSRGHVRARHGLPPVGWPAIGWDLVRAALNLLVFRRAGFERYAGAAAGAIAARRGRSALEREGLA
jgi:N-acetylglucosaminyl-diphospho-decaprenol L-rhamnosyltransferase